MWQVMPVSIELVWLYIVLRSGRQKFFHSVVSQTVTNKFIYKFQSVILLTLYDFYPSHLMEAS